jgi:hypothetical protein
MDLDKILEKVIELEVQKRIVMNAIFSPKPVNIMLVGPPGSGKSLILECIRDAFPLITNWNDAQTSSGIGVIESVLLMGKILRFLIVDELEKFKVNDLNVFLSLIEKGTISRKLANRKEVVDGFKVWFLSTCNDIELLRRKSPPLVNRCRVINVPALTYEQFIYVCSKRLLREPGITSEELGRYIAGRVYHDFGVTDMRFAVSLAQFAMGYVRRMKLEAVTKDVIDAVATDFKLVSVGI